MYVCKVCVKINPALLLLIHPFISPTFLMKRSIFLMGASRGSSPVP